MTFSKDTKDELAHIAPDKNCCILAELAGFIRVCGTIKLMGGGKFKVVITTEHNAVARHYKTLIKTYFGVDPSLEIGRSQAINKGKAYLMTLGPEELSEQILRETGILMLRGGMNYISDGIYEGLIKTKCCRKAYLRGLFLGTGTISNPEKGYQLEIVCDTEILAGDVKRLLNGFIDIHSKVVVRKGQYVVYVKAASQILDLLAIMGAHSQYFSFEDIRMKKELVNRTNRIQNCDQANIDKTIVASEKQISDIRAATAHGGLDLLPKKLREIAQMRLDNPDASMTEIGTMLDPPLKKAGVNNRFARIAEMAKERQKK
jgi:cell division protein WhiA